MGHDPDRQRCMMGLEPRMQGTSKMGNTDDDRKNPDRDQILDTPDLAGALESDHFRRFLDQVPIAIAVSELPGSPEQITFVNRQFESLTGLSAADIVGQSWTVLSALDENGDETSALGIAIIDSNDFVGTFRIERAGQDTALINAYSNVIIDDDDTPRYRLAALVDIGLRELDELEALEQRVREKDLQLLEVQHRVRNNLQMITTLVRLEARNARGRVDTTPFARLAGRIEALGILHSLLSEHDKADEIDLGVYLSQIASAVMRAHAVEGIRLDLKVDAYPVSVNVALPTGLMVNELMTNSLKHAFAGRDGGAIKLHSLTEHNGCRITIADDGAGLPTGVEWPRQGKLSHLIVDSLRINAKGHVVVESRPGEGMRVTILFSRADAAPNEPPAK